MNAGHNRSTPPTKLNTGYGADWLLSLATGPVLLGLVGAKVLSETWRQIGAMGEEIFRGDRLPLLNSPGDPNPDPDNQETQG